MRRRFRRTGGPGNAAIAAVTVCALCSGLWLLRDGTGEAAPPQPSAAQAHTVTAAIAALPGPPVRRNLRRMAN
jgi:hypothetical protein